MLKKKMKPNMHYTFQKDINYTFRYYLQISLTNNISNVQLPLQKDD